MVDIEQMILPAPGRSFEWRSTPGGPGLVCLEIERFAAHLFTTRHWTLGSRTAAVDDRGAWDETARAVGLDEGRLRRPRQLHGHTVVVASTDQNLVPADIIVNDDAAFAVAVQSADCVPLLLVDPVRGAVAAAHAGWRGLAARVPEIAVRALTEHFGSRPDDVIAAAGPSIGACCYEVGRDVRDAFGTAGFSHADLDRWFLMSPIASIANPPMPGLRLERQRDHWFFDGWASTREQLQQAGVGSDHIFSAELCTASHPDVLCSYRRDGAPAGRIAAVVSPRPQRP
jgi:purine-nucleoside/S-methyl-5'-thioadenosine phosphorylase / adenosine deaminase